MTRNSILKNPLIIAGLITLIVLVVTSQSLLLKPKTFEPGGLKYTHYNNYIIFKQSYFHLIGNNDLYQLYPLEHWDYYKYSPTFSLLMAPLAYMPNSAGLFLWNLLNVLVLFFALWKLPFPTDKMRLIAVGFILLELITSVQNSQSNALIAGMIIFAFLFLEKKQTALAALMIVLTIFIKLFGVVALALFIFYPDKWKAVLYTAGWTILFLVLPLIVVPISQLSFLYQSWLELLQNDHSASFGFSVAGWLYTWFGIDSKNLVVLIGAALFCIPLLKYRYFDNINFRLFFLSSILIWVVIFNHKAESPTFIIAVSGVAIWFFTQKTNAINLALLLIALILTSLSPTDIFPKGIRTNYVLPYVLKAVPCILIWFKITYDLIFFKDADNLTLGK